MRTFLTLAGLLLGGVAFGADKVDPAVALAWATPLEKTQRVVLREGFASVATEKRDVKVSGVVWPHALHILYHEGDNKLLGVHLPWDRTTIVLDDNKLNKGEGITWILTHRGAPLKIVMTEEGKSIYESWYSVELVTPKALPNVKDGYDPALKLPDGFVWRRYGNDPWTIEETGATTTGSAPAVKQPSVGGCGCTPGANCGANFCKSKGGTGCPQSCPVKKVGAAEPEPPIVPLMRLGASYQNCGPSG